jgi:hypothetical protein
MNKNRLKNYISLNSINNFLLEESFKEFIISTLTDDQLEEYGKKYGDWFNRQYDEIKNKRKNIQDEFVIKNLILFNHLQYPIENGELK